MTCSTCGHHGYHIGNGYIRMPAGPRYYDSAKVHAKSLYTHYCMVTPGIRKIKGGADFNGQERPKWCPLRTGEGQ